MRTPVISMVVLLAGVIAAAGSAQGAGEPPEAARGVALHCGVDTPPWRQGWREYGDVLARFFAADSRAAQGRTELQLREWPSDSVQLVANEAVCARIDSMARVWLGSAVADSLGIGASTWSTLAIFRVNPGKFLHYPSIEPRPAPHLVLVVDSASGVVTHQELAYDQRAAEDAGGAAGVTRVVGCASAAVQSRATHVQRNDGHSVCDRLRRAAASASRGHG